MNERLKEKMVRQVCEEFHSAYLYLAIAGAMELRGLKGFARWLYLQAEEEVEHAMKFFKFLLDRGQPIVLQEIPAVDPSWASPLEAFRQAHQHEQYISSRIHHLVDLAREVGDKPTEQFLQWFVEEQVEEEALTGEIVARLELAGNDGGALLLLDQEMGKREED